MNYQNGNLMKYMIKLQRVYKFKGDASITKKEKNPAVFF